MDAVATIDRLEGWMSNLGWTPDETGPAEKNPWKLVGERYTAQVWLGDNPSRPLGAHLDTIIPATVQVRDSTQQTDWDKCELMWADAIAAVQGLRVNWWTCKRAAIHLRARKAIANALLTRWAKAHGPYRALLMALWRRIIKDTLPAYFRDKSILDAQAARALG